MKQHNDRYLWVHGLLLFVTLSWGMNNIVMKLGFVHVTPQQFGALRMLMALPFLIYLAGFMPGRKPFERKDFFKIIFVGVIGMGMFQALFPLGVHYTSAPVGGILMATMPVQVVIISLLFRLERPGISSVAGVLLTIAGLAVITLSASHTGNGGVTTAWGVFFLVTAELGYAIHTTFLRTYMKRYSPLQVTGLAMSVSVVVYFAVFLPDIVKIDLSTVPAQTFGGAAFSGLVALSIANVFWNISIKHIGSTKVAVYGNMPTIFVLIFSALIFGELLRPMQLLGAVIILAGVLLVQMRNKEQILQTDADTLKVEEANQAP